VLKKVLIVDDSPAQVKLIHGLLEREGYSPIDLSDPLRVEETIAAEHPELVLLDVVMPERNGFQVCRELKASSEFGAIPVILVSRVVDIGLYLEALEGGICDFLVPPFSRSELAHVIGTALVSTPHQNAPAANRAAGV